MFDNRRKRGLIIGSILGDGFIYKRTSKQTDYIRYTMGITHSEKQLEYLKWKHQLLSNCFQTPMGKIYSYTRGKYTLFETRKVDKYLRIIYKWMYKNSNKTYTKQILQYLTPEAIAIWYMDDGSCYYKKDSKTGRIKSIEVVISTYCSLEEAKRIIEYFMSTYNIQWKLKKNKGLYCIRMSKKESVKFFDLIKPYIHCSMMYKIK